MPISTSRVTLLGASSAGMTALAGTLQNCAILARSLAGSGFSAYMEEVWTARAGMPARSGGLMRGRISSTEEVWAEKRVERLSRMIAALDQDLGEVKNAEWLEFWRDMRRLYSRANLFLTTAARTGDAGCLRTGSELWKEIEDLLQLAERRLGASG